MSDPVWLKIARTYVGQKEIAGAGNNPKIVAFSKRSTGSGQPDSVPWCAAFVGACLEDAGIRSTRKLNARSYMSWGNGVTQPQTGDVVVFWRGKKDGWQGHVAFFVKATATRITVLGGNQSDQVSVASYAKSQLLGYRRPSGVATVGEPEPVSLREAQTLLKKLGCAVGWVDGLDGPATRAAVRSFQGDAGLSIDGIVGPRTMAALREAKPKAKATVAAVGAAAAAGVAVAVLQPSWWPWIVGALVVVAIVAVVGIVFFKKGK